MCVCVHICLCAHVIDGGISDAFLSVVIVDDSGHNIIYVGIDCDSYCIQILYSNKEYTSDYYYSTSKFWVVNVNPKVTSTIIQAKKLGFKEAYLRNKPSLLDCEPFLLVYKHI